MSHFLKIGEGIDVLPLNAAIFRQPELWGAYGFRKHAHGSPHRDMTDIWIRYNDIKPFAEKNDFTGFHDLHTPVWYPAYWKLPQIRPLIFSSMQRMDATALGGVLITRIPAVGKILPHKDNTWHSRYFNTKVYIVLAGNDACWYRVEDDRCVMRAGEAWTFNNGLEHEVANEGQTERMTLIISMRSEG